jgi:transcriptional regulator with XRE-family HTH domain
MSRSNNADRLREFDREVMRGAFVSLFWAVISDRRKRDAFTLQLLADKLGVDKSTVSRWFSGEAPNWELDTIAAIANALDLEIRIQAIDRASGKAYTPAGPQPVAAFNEGISPKPVPTRKDRMAGGGSPI